MDNLDRLRKVLDFEGSLRHDPADRYEGYYPTVVRRLSGRDLVLGDALPAAASVRDDPIVPIEIEPAASLLVEEPRASEPPLVEVPVAPKGRGRKAKVVDTIPTSTVAEPEPVPEVPEEVAPASPDVGFEDEIEFLPFTQDGVNRAVEPELLEFEELWVERLPGAAALEPELAPPPPAVGDDGQVAPPLVEPVPGAMEAHGEETVVAEEEPAGSSMSLGNRGSRGPAEAPLPPGRGGGFASSSAEAELTPAADPLTVDGYTLYAKRASLRGGERTIHFFAREPTAGAVPATLPAGFEVERNPRSRLPYLRRIRTKAARSAKRKTVRSSKRRSKRNP